MARIIKPNQIPYSINTPPVLILNLDRSVDRREIFKEQFKNHEDEWNFYPAFDGKHITNKTIKGNISGGGYGNGRQFQNAELAIIMSHLGAIKTAKMLGYKDVIILEDDVAICEDWDYRLEILLNSLPKDWEYTYLSGHSDYTKFKQYETPVISKAPKMVGAFSYMVNHTAYDKIIDYCTSFMTTFDDMIMYMIAKNKLNGYVYFPFMTYHNANESLIWGETAKEHSSKKFFKNKI